MFLLTSQNVQNKIYLFFIINFIILIIFINARASSSVMEGSQIVQCSLNNIYCIQVSIQSAIVSNSGDSLYSKHTTIKHIKSSVKGQSPQTQSYFCEEFVYEIRTQFLLCDNRNSKKQTLSFTMDQDLVIKIF